MADRASSQRLHLECSVKHQSGGDTDRRTPWKAHAWPPGLSVAAHHNKNCGEVLSLRQESSPQSRGPRPPPPRCNDSRQGCRSSRRVPVTRLAAAAADWAPPQQARGRRDDRPPRPPVFRGPDRGDGRGHCGGRRGGRRRRRRARGPLCQQGLGAEAAPVEAGETPAQAGRARGGGGPRRQGGVRQGLPQVLGRRVVDDALLVLALLLGLSGSSADLAASPSASASSRWGARGANATAMALAAGWAGGAASAAGTPSLQRGEPPAERARAWPRD
eukprot:CAMPEP_0204517892 /NCGR_PEP_ID=MMETSP0661-20131031/3909_1 /ASSEMBLY_ACC=CAM_ASM_000606 /TAXON_ID=109239 /ORGANISM="Alexandrium margalefi, Strain AMGDE01CS-322" /LENGTH=273 /DNA_ID=CAMNT_0051523307 /DNA_START=143 /DNA_END=962 /DNA_ORIENTATION=-